MAVGQGLGRTVSGIMSEMYMKYYEPYFMGSVRLNSLCKATTQDGPEVGICPETGGSCPGCPHSFRGNACPSKSLLRLSAPHSYENSKCRLGDTYA